MRATIHDQKSRVTTLLYYSLSSLLWDRDRPLWFQCVLFLISQFQILLTLLWIQINYLFETSDTAFCKLLAFITKALTVEESLDAKSENLLVGYILGLVLIYFLLLFIVWIFLLFFFFWNPQSQASKRIRSITSYWAQIHHEVLFWFIAVLLSFLFSQQSTLSFEHPESVKGTFIGLIITGLVFNYGSALFFSWWCFDPFRNNNTFACHKTTFQLFTFLSKGIMISTLFFFADSDASKHIIFVSNIIFLAVRHHLLMRNFPYFHHFTMKVVGMISTSTLLWTFSQYVVWFLPYDIQGSESIIIFFQIAFACLNIKIYLSTFEKTVSIYFKKEPTKLLNYNDVQKKLFSIFYMLNNIHFLINDENHLSSNQHFIYFIGYLSTYKDINKPNPMFSNIMSTATTNIENTYKLQHMYSESLYQMAIDVLIFTSERLLQFKSILQTDLACLIFERKNLYPKTIYLLTNIQRYIKSHEEGVRVYRYVQDVQQSLLRFLERREGGDLDLKRAVDFEQGTSKLFDDILTNTERFKKLWTFYLEPHVRLREFIELSTKFENEAQALEKSWSKLEKTYDQTLTNIYPLYSAYLTLVRNAFYSSGKIEEKFYHSRDFRRKDNDMSAPLVPESLIGTRNMLFQVLMSKEKLGKISYCSKNVTHEVGWSQEEIIGKNISYIMPPYMQNKHQNILLANLEILPKRFFNTYINSFVRTNEGFIVPSTTIATLYPYIRDELTYFGIIRTHKFRHESIVIDDNGYIDSFTRRVAIDLSLSITDKRIHLKKICPIFQRKLRQALNVCSLHDVSLYPLSKALISIIKAVQENEDLMMKIEGKNQIQTAKAPTFKLPFVSPQKGGLVWYLVNFDIRDIDQSDVIVMNLFENKNDNNSVGSLALDFVDEEEPDEFNFDDVNEVFENEMDRYFTHGSLMIEKTKRFTNRNLLTRVKETGDGSKSSGSDTNNAVSPDRTPTLEETSYQGQMHRQFLSSTKRALCDSKRVSGRKKGATEFVRKSSYLLTSPPKPKSKTFFSKTSSTLLINNNDYTVNINQLKETGEINKIEEGSPKVLSDQGHLITPDSLIKVKQIFPKKKLSAHHDAVSAHDSGTSISMESDKKIEQALYLTPEDGFRKKFGLLLRFFFLVCICFLVASQISTTQYLNTLRTKMQIFKLFKDCLHGSLHLYGIAGSLVLLDKGIYSNDRYASMNIDNLFESQKEQARDLSLKIQQLNINLSNLVISADEDIKNEIFEKKAPGIYNRVEDDQIRSTMILNDFTAIEQIVKNAFKISKLKLEDLSEQALPTFNYIDSIVTTLLLSGDVLNEVLVNECNQTARYIVQTALYFMLIPVCLGIVILLVFLYSDRQASANRNLLIEGLLRLDEDLIKEHLAQVNIFYVNLKKDVYSRNLYESNEFAKTATISTTSRAEKKFIKKNADEKGVNGSFTTLSSFLGVLLFIILSVFCILFGIGDKVQNEITENILIYFTAKEFHIQIDTLQVYFTNFIAENNSTYLKNQQIEQQWENMYKEMATAHDFFAQTFYLHLNQWGQEQKDYLKQLIQGDLCSIQILDGISEAKCQEMAEGSFNRGIISVNSFILSGFRKAKDYFVFSNRSQEAIKETLHLKEVVINEEIKEPYVTSVYKAIENILENMILTIMDDFVQIKFKIMISYLVLYIFLGVTFVKKFMELVQAEKAKWRKLFRHIPYQVLRNNKILLNYLMNNSNKLLVSLKSYIL